MPAPVPVLICAATLDYIDPIGTWETFRYAKRLYTRMGFSERIDILENFAGHNYNQTQREGVVRWMSRWLLGKDRPITEPPIVPLSEKEYLCTAKGQVMLIPGARSLYDLNDQYENDLARRRAAAWAGGNRAALMDQVRRLAGIRKLADLPAPKVELVGTVTWCGSKVEKLLIKPEEGISLPALWFSPENTSLGRAVVYVRSDGKACDPASCQIWAKAGEAVLAVDLRGTGQTQHSGNTGVYDFGGPEYQNGYSAYLLGRSYVGMRAEDVLVCARYAARRVAGGREGSVRLEAVGNVGIPALHAAALEPNLFAKIKLANTLGSWKSVVHRHALDWGQSPNLVHDALEFYDLPDLVGSLGKKIEVATP